MRKSLPACALDMLAHLEEAIVRLGASARATTGIPGKLTRNERPVAIHIDTLGNETSGGVYTWRTPERTEGGLPRKLMLETLDGRLIGDWRREADDWIEELVAVQRRDDDLVARGLDPKRPPASSLTVHRIVHDMLEADGRGGLHDPGLFFEKGGYAMPWLARDEGAPTDGPLFMIDLRPMGGRLEANKVGTSQFWFEQEGPLCRVVHSYPLESSSPLPDTMILGIVGADLADVIGHGSITSGHYIVRGAEIIRYTDSNRLSIVIDDQQVPLIAD